MVVKVAANTINTATARVRRYNGAKVGRGVMLSKVTPPFCHGNTKHQYGG